jgi:hypothetical protein
MAIDDYLLDNRERQAAARFDALSALFDDVTRRHVVALGIEPGWRCWEVGAGGASVPAWLAQQVGTDGTVLATDIDPSWVGGVAPDGVEVRRHDVAQDDPPERGFDSSTPGSCSRTSPTAARRCGGWRPRCVPAATC